MTSRAANKTLKLRAGGLFVFVLLSALGSTLSREPETSAAAPPRLASPEPQRRAPSGRTRSTRRSPPSRGVGARRTDYKNFNHATAKHREQACDACHKFPSPDWKAARTGDAAFPDVVRQPDHPSCLKCHREQFFARERPAPAICSVCHTNSTPRNSTRHPFPNPPETFNRTTRAREFHSDFQIFFPHDKHIEVVSALRPAHDRDAGARFVRASLDGGAQQKEAQKPVQEAEKPNETSCAVCHQTYQPQGESEDEYATKPPADLGEAFWLKKGTFKTSPNHANCFNCHSQESGVLPAPNDCAACHRLPAASAVKARTDFDAKVAASINVNDPVTLRQWRRRNGSGTYRHEWVMHADLSCNTCHDVLKMNTLEEATKRVSILSCGGGGSGCHITPTSEEGGVLNLALDARKAKPDAQCTKCHVVLGRQAVVPKSHTEAVERIKGTGAP